MIRTGICILVFAMATPAFAQHKARPGRKQKDTIVQQARQINALLASYDTLVPFAENQQEGIIDSIGNEIITRLLAVLNDPSLVNHRIETLFKGEELLQSRSADGNIWFFSIDEKTGGSYRTSKTLICYRLPDGRIKAEPFGGEEEEPLSTSTYADPVLVNSATRQYIVIGAVATCNTCAYYSACTLQIDSDAVQYSIITDYDGRSDLLLKLEYNGESKTLESEYYSPYLEDTLYSGNAEDSGYRYYYKSTFRYWNGMFVEAEACRSMLAEE